MIWHIFDVTLMSMCAGAPVKPEAVADQLEQAGNLGRGEHFPL